LGRALVLLGGSWVVLTAAVLVLRFTVLDHDAMAPLLLPFCVSELLAGRLVDLAAQCFQAQDRLSVSGSLSVYLSGARLLTIGLFAALTQSHSPGSFALWYVGASICVAIYAAVRVRRAFGSPSFRSLQGLEIRLGLTFSLGTASKSIYGDIDKFMLSSIGSSASTGIYTAAYRIVSMAFAPVFAYCYASNVRFFRAGRGGERAVWSVARSAYPAIFIYTCAVSVLLVVTAPLLPLILGHSYHESVSALRWLAVMPIVQGGHSLFGDAMMGAGRQGARAAAQLGAALLNCGLNVWLIPVLSWKGAAIASIACELSLAIVLMLMLRSMGAATEPTNGAEAGPDVSTLET
jgi:O-antigen/teichoic acid export membrane protein